MCEKRHNRLTCVCLLISLAGLIGVALAPPLNHPYVYISIPEDADSGPQLYDAACAGCHGVDGTGESRDKLGFEVLPPDFTDCVFAGREPAADWVTVAGEGGPVRGFSRLMPAFGDALTPDQLEKIMAYVGAFCTDGRWPRGELNIPKPLVTEKAYPEDEAYLRTTVSTEGAGNVINKFVYEKRFGARNQIEVAFPFGAVEQVLPGSSEWSTGVADISLGLKRVLFHSANSGSIVSLTGELILPTGDEQKGFGKGFSVFEPFATYGQLLPANAFFHTQAGVELPFDSERAENEAFWRATLGKSFARGAWGRTWSPMIEVLGSSELEGGDVSWDVVPQVQVTLNQRQHIMANIGVQLPLTDADLRSSRVMVYLLWDWFDGGFFEGW